MKSEIQNQLEVLDKGFVRLDGALADDLSVVNAARVSFAQHKDAVDAADEGLIRFLMKNRHGTPFEHNFFSFHVKAPIFVAREWMRHRVGSFNEWSGRYSKLEPEFYIPDWVRTQVGKPGAYTYEPMEDKEMADFFIGRLENYSDAAYEAYLEAIHWGVAKELARLFLPVNIYTQFYWSVNARSLMNFLSLRCAPEAMLEIRAYAETVFEMFEAQMPVTAQAFREAGLVAP